MKSIKYFTIVSFALFSASAISLSAGNVIDSIYLKNISEKYEHLSSVKKPEKDSCLSLIEDCLSIATEYEENYIYSAALDWHKKVCNLYSIIKDKDEVANEKFKLAELYVKRKQYHETYYNLSQAIEHYKKENNQAKLSDCYSLYGLILYECRKYEECTEKFRQSLSFATGSKDTSKIIRSMNNYAIFKRPRNDSESIGILEDAIELCRQTKDSTMLLKIKTSLASFLILNGKSEKTDSLISYIGKHSSKILEIGEFHYLEGIRSMKESDTENAIANLEKALTYFCRGEMYAQQKVCYMFMHKMYSNSGNYMKAYEYLLKFNNIDKELGQMDMFMKLFDYQQEILTREKESEAKEKFLKVTILFLTLLFLFSVSILLYIMRLRKKASNLKIKEANLENTRLQQEKLQQEIKTSNEIVEIKRLQQVQLDNMLKDIISRLSDMSEHSETSSMLKEEIDSLKEDLCISMESGELKEISQYIPKFNSRFFMKLINDFPDLSVNERRLCSLLDMNLTTKEISEITKQSIASINVARGRLRNKLGLTGKTCTIQEFLAKYHDSDS